MVHIAPWKTAIVVIICLLGFVAFLPNMLPASTVEAMKAWRVLPTQTLNFGLDLRGGSQLLLEVKEDKVILERIKAKVDEVRSALRKAEIPYTGLGATATGVNVKILDAGKYAAAREALEGLSEPIGGLLAAPGFGQRNYEISEGEGGQLSMIFTDAAKIELRQQVMAQSVEVVRKRVDGTGTKEANIQRQGADRILVQVPGLNDPARLIDILGKTAKMTFHLVDDSADPQEAVAGRVPPGSVLRYEQSDVEGGQGQPIVIREQTLLTGDMLERASADFHPQTRQPVVNFSFNTQGARRFADITRDNTGKRFAIVLDEVVITAPRINTPILGGSGFIEGNFTSQSALDLAVLLNAGALPAEIAILEQRVVGEELGQDAIENGEMAAIMGFAIMIIFMAVTYGLFGVFANIALLVNLVLLAGAFTVFGLTLTLPGIAAFVLTMGMAVDANVLIYERIREERRLGKSLIASIDAGFERAMATIIDSNLTALISGLILIMLATGPVRGFGVGLSLGIVTSVFTAIWVTRLMVVWWLRQKPKDLAM